MRTRIATHAAGTARRAQSASGGAVALVGYLAAGIGAVALVLGAAMLAGALVVAVVVRGVARALLTRVDGRVAASAARAEAVSAEPLRAKPRPRVAG